ncbi:hypothetical protein GCM10010121_082950 [Streptomyces brasiliensis]|uniref:Uncharacterized protein n=1 Tax=Streptomyces brasiliensis TaxID=1954 RepID=A0A917P3B6_9ACTN|nr:hypothetical protein GCM10010121_082950 [Streptomyces brasiliensis]
MASLRQLTGMAKSDTVAFLKTDDGEMDGPSAGRCPDRDPSRSKPRNPQPPTVGMRRPPREVRPPGTHPALDPAPVKQAGSRASGAVAWRRQRVKGAPRPARRTVALSA